MSYTFTHYFRLLVVAAVVGIALNGCSGGKDAGVKPAGHLLVQGQPYGLDDGERVDITFFTAERARTSAAATVGPDGTFTVRGTGLTPGDYVIAVISTNCNAPPGEQYKDKFGQEFSGPSSPLRISVGAELRPHVTIDLTNKTAAVR